MQEKFDQFREIYIDYLNRIKELDLEDKAKLLGAEMQDSELLVPFLGKKYRISGSGVLDMQGNRPLHAVIVTLCQYLLLSPDKPVQDSGEWFSFRDFPNAAPFAGAFVTNVEENIAKNFAGRLDSLHKASEKLPGYLPATGLSYDFIRVFSALPRVEAMLLFNDMDEEFPAESKVLFPRVAEKYLDMECLAMIGWLLADYLSIYAGWGEITIM